MAEILETFDFTRSSGRAKYPWADWMDGQIYKIKRGEDFTATTKVMRQQIYAAAKNHGKSVRSTSTATEIIFQATEESSG
tara:strand:+ start:671 stop:910 length:240 start_codon:yes stop_codon:yes gene_type:complete